MGNRVILEPFGNISVKIKWKGNGSDVQVKEILNKGTEELSKISMVPR